MQESGNTRRPDKSRRGSDATQIVHSRRSVPVLVNESHWKFTRDEIVEAMERQKREAKEALIAQIERE